MFTMYMAAIAGIPVGLFHDPGPTLAAQYPEQEHHDPLGASIINDLERRMYADWVGVVDDSKEAFDAFLEVLRAHERVWKKD